MYDKKSIFLLCKEQLFAMNLNDLFIKFIVLILINQVAVLALVYSNFVIHSFGDKTNKITYLETESVYTNYSFSVCLY